MLEDNTHRVEALKGFDKINQLLASPAYLANQPFLNRLFNHPKVFEVPGCRPRVNAFLRIVQWNIEYGKRLDEVARALNEHSVLRFADLLLINEVDEGMARSGNVAVAEELSKRIEAHAVFGAEYLELTGRQQSVGAGAVALLSSSEVNGNTAALHGCAILTRHRFSNPTVVRLPRCEDNFASVQKRLGGRAGVIVKLHLSGREITAATAHLDVVNTPRCRQAQMRALLEAVDSGDAISSLSPVIVGGDLNTHTFARGGRLRGALNLARILIADRQALARDLMNPSDREPLLREFGRFGYHVAGFNDGQPTNQVGADELGASSSLPAVVRKLALKRLGGPEFSLPFRLDWFAARGLVPLSEGEVKDREMGARSIGPRTVSGLQSGGRRLSDHDPIVVDIRI
jgi:endonuclease/exonuclease/phosphatase family metal-dependent hydrolase